MRIAGKILFWIIAVTCGLFIASLVPPAPYDPLWFLLVLVAFAFGTLSGVAALTILGLIGWLAMWLCFSAFDIELKEFLRAVIENITPEKQENPIDK